MASPPPQASFRAQGSFRPALRHGRRFDPAAARRPIFADRYADYGLTVILDHGDHYYLVYASLDRVDTHVGDTLPSASRIGIVGGAEGRPGELYFELRRRAETIDPAPWLGL